MIRFHHLKDLDSENLGKKRTALYIVRMGREPPEIFDYVPNKEKNKTVLELVTDCLANHELREDAAIAIKIAGEKGIDISEQ